MASTSQMLNQQARDWDKEFLDKLGIPTNMLGELWEPGHRVGRCYRRGSGKDWMQEFISFHGGFP